MMCHRLLAILALALHPASTAAQNSTVVEIAIADPDTFSTLVTLLEAADLVETLSGDGPFTVFAPTNDAFAKLIWSLEYFLAAENKAELQSVLLYHVLAGQVLSTAFADDVMAETVQGALVTAQLDPAMINDANVTSADVLATNGVVHVIDKVLVPPGPPAATLAPSTSGPTQSIVEILSADPDTFSWFVGAAAATNAINTLSGDGPFTVFASTDDAWAVLSWGGNQAELESLVLYHVLAGQVLSTDLTDGLVAETVQGASVTVHLDPLMINDANVTSTDVLATNGVIHVIDKVLVPPPTQSIVEIASADPYWFSTLVTLLEAADLVDTLSGDGQFTVFAPTNDAFAELDLEYYLAAENKAELQSVLLYHVLAGQVLSTDLSDGLVAETVQGASVTAHLNPLMINDANLNRIDVLATNGVIHRITKVLAPPGLPAATLAPSTAGPTQSIVEIASADPDTFSTLVAALEAADLVETLSGDGPFTVFAPSNDAFAELDLEYYLAAENKAELENVLLYHVLAGQVLSTDLTDGLVAETVQGASVTAQLDPVMINDANVVSADVLATNGVIHVIDKVLVPPPEESDSAAPVAKAFAAAVIAGAATIAL